MASHLSSLGFLVESVEDFVALAERLLDQTQSFQTRRGAYRLWSGQAGEQLWLQLDRSGALIGINPHFAGKASMTVGITNRVARPEDTELDAAFHGWADPSEDSIEDGAYPFVFDSPDAGTSSGFTVPAIARVQLAAFAHEVTAFESEAAYHHAQPKENLRFASRSFIPAGLFSPDGGGRPEVPEAIAIFTGHVLETTVYQNTLTGLLFYWALVETYGGQFDVVIDPDLLAEPPQSGGILSGTFWLSGRITAAPRSRTGWLGRLFNMNRRN